MAADTRPRLWLVDKPAGPTSHDVVAQVRRRLPRRTKVGHAGTLDPFATGLLVVLSGRATRLASLLSGLDKGYLTTIRTGFTSETGDTEGPITSAGAPADGARIAAALEHFRGPQMQRPPAYSAVKVGGERLYARARRGDEAQAAERPITVHRLELVDDLGDGRAVLSVRCSKGTYIRQLVADIGARLGCGAYCETLRRTHVGDLDVVDALPPDEVVDAGGIDPLRGLAHLAAQEVDAHDAEELSHGRPVAGEGEGRRLLVHDGELLAVGEADGAGTVRPRIVLRPAEGAR